MRTIVVGLLFLAGCAAPVNLGTGIEQTPKKEDKEDPKAKLPQTLTERYGGRNAEEWGNGLLDANGEVSKEASFALRAIGPESLRFVLKGFDSPHAMVRLRSVATALHEENAGKYPEVFQPALVKLLADENREVRGWAALGIARCGFKSSASEIRSAMDNEKDAEAKRQMKAALDEIAKKK